jgi:hypothetical protein
MTQTVRFRGRWTPEDRIVSAWHYLSVEVPIGCAGLRAELRYDRSAPALLNLGCLGPNGFRGWSGGARDWFAITPAAATPGYLPGELEPGRWQVIIGLYRVPTSGVSWELNVETFRRAPDRLLPDDPSPGAVPAPAERPSRRPLPAAVGRVWLAGDLHTHTVHSDGELTVPELAALAVRRGLDFLAVTDHNTISHHASLSIVSRRYGVTLLPGQEVTTDRGHAGALGDVGWIDFRLSPDEWLNATDQAGGLLSVNHPFAGADSWIYPMRHRPPLLEVWHFSWQDMRWTTPLSWWLAWDPAAVPVGGSDWHRPGTGAPPGQPTTWVECEVDSGQAGKNRTPADLVSVDAVLDGLRAGRVAISAKRDGPVLLRHDGDLLAIGADGLILVGPDGPCTRVRGDRTRFSSTPGCHRLTDDSGRMLALTP